MKHYNDEKHLRGWTNMGWLWGLSFSENDEKERIDMMWKRVIIIIPVLMLLLDPSPFVNDVKRGNT